MRRGSVAGARELRTRLGAYLRKVRQGATVVVTDRGEPIAELRPIGHAAGAGLVRLVASGAVTRRVQGRLAPFRPIRLRGGSLSTAVVEDRF